MTPKTLKSVQCFLETYVFDVACLKPKHGSCEIFNLLFNPEAYIDIESFSFEMAPESSIQEGS